MSTDAIGGGGEGVVAARVDEAVDPDGLVETAWVLIANVRPDWRSQGPEWQEAAQKWRDAYARQAGEGSS